MFWETISDESCSMAIDYSRVNNNAHHLVDPMDVSAIHEISPTSELSFYADELENGSSGSNGSNGMVPNSPLPTMLGLLSPEGSPVRFQIVSRRKSPQQNATTLVTTTTNDGQLNTFHSLSSTCSMDSTTSTDDEYMELIEMESLVPMQAHNVYGYPTDLNTLISGQIVTAQQQRSPLRSSVIQRIAARRCLSLSTESQLELQQQQQQASEPKTPELLRSVYNNNDTNTPTSSNMAFKRPDPPSHSNSPIQLKRLRGVVSQDKENLNNSFEILRQSQSSPAVTKSKSGTLNAVTRPPLRKSMSMNDAEIMTALSRSDSSSEPELIGDFSKPFVLPLMEGRHCDLKSISSDTVAKLLQGQFRNEVSSYKIIDCRYPYEFEGGHIHGALNLYTQEQIIEEFLSQQKTDHQEQQAGNIMGHKRNIIIFHCEFSSERGPRLSRFLRGLDRTRNTHTYPNLDYPEIYLLHNGYKEFYQTHKELCDPVSYRPMLEPSFTEAYRHFRAKSKSWNGDSSGVATSRHMKKSRSRLML